MTTIAFLGLGRMGTLMAGRVRPAGHDLVVWNRTPERTRPLVAEGARAAGTPAEAAREAEIMITMLAGRAALEAVMAGPDGIAGATDAAGLPQLAAARDWLRTAAAEGAADVDVRDVVEYIRPGQLGTAEPSAR
jgi:3-hydroxyisobutyrate dehydrogenase